MANGGLTPYQLKLLKEWKGENIEIKFTNPNDPKEIGRIVEIDVHRNVFMIKSIKGRDKIIMNGVKTIKKLTLEEVTVAMNDLIPETLPVQGSSRKQYGVLPEA